MVQIEAGEVLVALRALAISTIAHCRFNWVIDEFRVRPLPCQACRQLAEALGIALDSPTVTGPDRPS